MSDNFIDKNNANLTKNVIENLEFGNRELSENIVNDDIQIQYDHMYATNHEQNGLLLADDTQQPPCQSTESEVNFIKDFLLIHLDLIQQQNDDIINKENTIFLLQQENQQLREKIKSLETKLVEASNAINVEATLQTLDASNPEDMIIDSTTIVVEQIPIVQPASNLQVVVGVPIEEPIEGHSGQVEASPAEAAEEDIKPPLIASIKAELPDHNEYSTSDYTHSSYTIHSSCNDQMKNLKMSIRRKRLCSNSSALSNNGSTSDEKKTFRHSRKKRKRIVKNDELLTHADEYVTQVGDVHMMDIIRRQELAEEVAKTASSANLEVPRWRVKVYTSCYSLEGTENLEDDVFLRRHTRMENDEKRRKRWDVQRIREQRVIEKLKQRQDKIDSNSKCSANTAATEEAAEPLNSLWPALDDIKYIEKCDDLPVSAFGTPIPKIQPSVFSLPWLNNPHIKKTLRRSGMTTTNTGRRRRRSSKR